jgi:hypothetical protein
MNTIAKRLFINYLIHLIHEGREVVCLGVIQGYKGVVVTQEEGV